MEGPGAMPNGPGVYGPLGDITDGDMTPGGGGNMGGPWGERWLGIGVGIGCGAGTLVTTVIRGC